MKFIRKHFGNGLIFAGVVLLVIAVGLSLLGWGYCAINYGGRTITEIPSICLMLTK